MKLLGATICAGAILSAPAGAAERAYELVTPADSTADVLTYGGFASPGGDTVFFTSGDSLADAVPNGPLPTVDGYIARRGSGGWTTAWATPAPTGEPGTQGSRTLFASADGSRQVMGTENSIDPDDTFAHSMDTYVNLGGTVSWVSRGPRAAVESRLPVAATPGIEQVLFTTRAQMVPEDTDAKIDTYRWSDDGVTLVSVATTEDAAVPLRLNTIASPGMLSDDGRVVFFQTTQSLTPDDTDPVANAAAMDFYARVDGTTTRMVTVDRRPVPGATANAPTMVGASSNGDVVCFSTRSQLAAGDSDNADDVYCYRLSTDTLERVSAGTGDNDANAARGLALSRDGSSVFFSTATALTADDTDGGQSLYVRSAGVTTYVSRLAPTDLTARRRAAVTSAGHRALVLGEDGNTAVFTTDAAAVPADTDTTADVYRWTRTGGLQIVSQGAAGGNGAFPAETGAYEPAGPASIDVFTSNQVSGRMMTTDGAAVFFETAEALVAADTDGGRIDVYQWTAANGVELVSPGGAANVDNRYLDSSADGSTVFLVTAESILPQDANGGAADVYAARVGGGFPVPDLGSDLGAAPGGSTPVAVPSRPGLPTAQSGADSGSSPVPSAASPTTPARTATPVVRFGRVSVDGQTVTLRVRVNAAGSVKARLVAAKGGGVLASGSRRFSGSGTATLRLKLTKAGGKALAGGSRISARVRVQFDPADGESVQDSRSASLGEGRR